MRKKYLSALLFGALLFASAGTFTSCKDYDDDISNLQSQVDGIKADLEDLQAQISAGKWITNVTSIEGGFTVTFSDGQSFNIVNGKDGADGADGAAGADGTKITIGEDGYWYFDGIKSEYKAVADTEDGKIKTPYVGEDGYWYFYGEEGEEAVKSAYKANGAVYAVAEANGGFTIYAPTEDGKEMLEIFLPGAAAAITSMNVEVRTTDGKITINQYTFNPDKDEKAAWEKMTGHNVTDNKYILASADKLGLRVNPTDVELKDIDFVLLNSKNEELTGVVYEASEYTDYVTAASRANGNGLWTLSMKQMELKDDDAETNFTKLFTSNSANILYALSADHATRAEYNIGFNSLNPKDANIGSIKVAGKNVKDDTDTSDTKDKRNDGMVDTHKAISVAVENPADLYDMWLTVSKEDEALFGIEIDNEKHTFTITGDPDLLTKASFAVTVHTMNNNGEVAEEVVNIYVSDKIAVAPEYAKRTLNIVTDDADALKNKNAFTADMATLLNALGDTQADVWKKKVTAASVAYYTDEACTKSVTGADGIELIFVNAKGDAQAAIKDATNMKFSVDNSEASSVFVVDKEYFAKVTFKAGSSELNSIVIPFQFAIPDFANSFEQEPAVFIDGVANAYMNVSDYNAAVKAGKAKAAYKLSNAFANYLKDAKLALDKETKIGETGKTSAELATIDATFNETAMIYLQDVDKAKGTNIPAGYGQELIVNASADDYMGWEYPEGEGTYSFTIKVMSPLYEGTVSAIGDVVNIPATSVSGWNMTNEHIQGKTYNNITYKVLQDKVGDWTRPEIAEVDASSTNERVVKVEGVHPATAGEKGAVNEGYIKVLPQNIAATTETTINVTVTDVWGYAKTNPVKVNVTVGE
ncbi:PL29 family lyase N-terminal domain-containing protein [Bacteroides sp. An19]|uniref:PL29 family lyase N-terminal domain-containing protein n=1 Tax=Bacteroides sp. An19 TaxID=1965580 RepID=UPI000B3B066A|nr:PL29 family lyase N-terminal domain-containing protein [Bacteroides sp. An19]OUP32426.1 hypothetical protein B5F25_08890 [Bacteroides sp. An19]